jgi:AcrR family transcriptional regulator
MPTGLRQQKKAETRAALVKAAHDLFHTKGYEATTIEEIAELAAVSRRTFFRYFPTKEDLVFPQQKSRLRGFMMLLETHRPEETPFETLRHLTAVFAAEYERHSDKIIEQQELILTSPDLRAREREIDRAWEATMFEYLAKWGGGGREAEHRARVLAGAAIGVIRATLRYWFSTGGKEDLNVLGQEALDFLEQGFRKIVPMDHPLD